MSTTVTIAPRPYDVSLDSCIADEIVRLNSEGVYTVNSCCGHGESPPVALITANHGSLGRAYELGYEPKQFDGLIYQIKLKSRCICEGR